MDADKITLIVEARLGDPDDRSNEKHSFRLFIPLLPFILLAALWFLLVQ